MFKRLKKVFKKAKLSDFDLDWLSTGTWLPDEAVVNEKELAKRKIPVKRQAMTVFSEKE